MRIVFDTNVLARAHQLAHGPARRALLFVATGSDVLIVFRHAYTFDLRWDRMKTLVLRCEETLQLVEGELDRFFEAGTGGQ